MSWKMKVLHFCQPPNWHFERSHRSEEQHGESDPGSENRRPVLRPPRPGLKAAELDTGLRKRWQQRRVSALHLCFGMPKMDISVRCGPLQECFVHYLQTYRLIWDHKTEDPWENLCSTTHGVVLTYLYSIYSTSWMVFHPIRPQHSPLVPLWCSGSRLMGQIPQFC